MQNAAITTDQRQAPAGDTLGMRRTWQSPRLSVLGEVRSLTEGGSAGALENNPMCGRGDPNAMC